MSLTPAQHSELLSLARQSIEATFANGAPYSLPDSLPGSLPGRLPGEPLGSLAQIQATFVTLLIAGALRGCCGTIEARHPLTQDVWRNAWASAFNDPRFAPLTPREWRSVEIQISVLSEPEPLACVDETTLLQALRPNIDGLIVELGTARATFLPSVWRQLRDAEGFLRQLKIKAGWAADFWSPHVKVWRYQTETFGEMNREGEP